MDEERFIQAGIEQGEKSAYRRALEGYRAAQAFSTAVCMDCQCPLGKTTKPDDILGEVCPKCALKAMIKAKREH